MRAAQPRADGEYDATDPHRRELGTERDRDARHRVLTGHDGREQANMTVRMRRSARFAT